MGILDRLRGSSDEPEPQPTLAQAQSIDVPPVDVPLVDVPPTLADAADPQSGGIDGSTVLEQQMSEQGTVDPAAGEPQMGEPQMGEQRGDFMLLPPLRPTFGLPARFQHRVSEFAVTRRPIAVTDAPLTHAVEPERLGSFVARARRTRGRPRPRRSDLVHRQDETVGEFDEGVEDHVPLPPVPAPRRLKASPPPAAPPPRPDPEPELPSVAEVRRAVVNPAPVPARSAATIQGTVVASTSSPAPGGLPAFDPTSLPRAARSEITDDVPVIRRRPSRGRVSEPIANSVDEENAELLESFVQGITSDVEDSPGPSIPVPPLPAGTDPGMIPEELPAPRAADLPPLIGSTRVRGATPPSVETPDVPDRPTLADSEPMTGKRPALAPASAPVPEPVVSASVPAAPSGPAPESAPPPGTPADAEPPRIVMPRRVDGPRADVSDEDGGSDGAGPDRRASSPAARPTLASRAPLVSSGRTGVQRLARDDDAGPPLALPVRPARSAAAAPAAPAAPPAPPRAMPVPPAPAAPTTVETDAGPSPAPTVLVVPQPVREAVAKAVGTSPATVPVHQGESTDAMTDEINAQAFTRDGEIHLAGDVSLATPEGQAVLAHELTHVVQQRGGTQTMPHESSEEGQAHEEQAREVQRTLLAPPSAPEVPDLAFAAPPAPVPLPVSVPAEAGVQRSPRPAGASAEPTPARASAPAPAAVSAAPAPSVAMRRAPAAKATAAPPVRSTPPQLETLGPPRASSTSESQVVVPAGVQRNRRRDPSLDAPGGAAGASVPAIRDGEDVFDPFGGEDRQEQHKPKWFQSGGKLDSLFSSDQGYDDVDDDDEDDPRADLERQAESLYPLIRARLRAELVRDRERRGRLAREWR